MIPWIMTGPEAFFKKFFGIAFLKEKKSDSRNCVGFSNTPIKNYCQIEDGYKLGYLREHHLLKLQFGRVVNFFFSLVYLVYYFLLFGLYVFI